MMHCHIPEDLNVSLQKAYKRKKTASTKSQFHKK